MSHDQRVELADQLAASPQQDQGSRPVLGHAEAPLVEAGPGRHDPVPVAGSRKHRVAAEHREGTWRRAPRAREHAHDPPFGRATLAQAALSWLRSRNVSARVQLVRVDRMRTSCVSTRAWNPHRCEYAVRDRGHRSPDPDRAGLVATDPHDAGPTDETPLMELDRAVGRLQPPIDEI